MSNDTPRRPERRESLQGSRGGDCRCDGRGRISGGRDSPNGDRPAPGPQPTLFLAGIEFLPIPSVHFTPNFEVITYDGVNPKPKTDVVARLTFYWTF